MFTQKVILKYNEIVEHLFINKNGSIVSFNTFFNSLNLYAIKHYTDGKNLSINLDYQGDAKVKVIFANKDKSEVLFESEHLLRRIEIDLTKLDEQGIVYPEFDGDFKLKEMTYEVDAPSEPVKVAVIFTTFNRQEFLIPNLKKIDSCSNIYKTIVVDNAKNVSLPNELSKGKFIVIPNDNLGGTGGFTRGMIESKKVGATHMFIMDDDITLLPEVVEKAVSLISCLNKQHENDWLGFSMLLNGSPTIQFEFGSTWSGIRMNKNHSMLDLTKLENLYLNQISPTYNYSAWWSLIMPVSVIDRYQYPFPFFIKFDDIEFALRREKEEIILTNGFAVWHEDFDKKYNPYLEYYLLRNALVTNSLHDKHSLFHSLLRFTFKGAKSFFKRNTIIIRLMGLGIDDFLIGTKFFSELDIEKKNTEIRNVAKEKINFFKASFLYTKYFWKLLFKFASAKKDYVRNTDLLTSESYWNKVFNNVK